MAKILVVDDSFLARDILSKSLQSLGYEVVLAANGKEALEKFSAELFDCVCLDLLMPLMGGYELIAALKAKEKETGRVVPLVVVSSDIQKTTADRCLNEFGVAAFFEKQYFRDREKLSAVLTQVIRA